MKLAKLLGWAIVMASVFAPVVHAGMPPGPPVLPAPGPRSQWKMCGKCNGRGQLWKNGLWVRCDKCDGRGWIFDPAWDRDWRGRRRHSYDDCFVATAAYGSAWEPNVATLRGFRDQCLMTSPVGRGAVELYYAASPPLAAWIAERPWARGATRVALTPAVTLAGALTGQPADMAIVGGAVAFGILGIPRLRRALKRRRASPKA